MTQEVAERALREGIALLDVGRTDEAIDRLGAAIAEDPSDARARCHLALALIGVERHGEALEVAGSATALEPEWEWPHRLRALALLGLQRPGEALAPAYEAVRLEPELASPREVLGDVLAANGHFVPAIQAAQQAQHLDPESAGPHHTMGNAYAAAEQWDAAITAYKAALERDPDDAMLHNNLGVALLNKGADDEAHLAFERAVRIDPNMAMFRQNLTLAGRVRANGGWVLLLFGLPLIVFLQASRHSDLSGGDRLAIASAIAIAGLLVWLLSTWAYMLEASPGERELLKTQPFFERFDFVGWQPWPFLVPSPIWFGASVIAVAIVVSNIVTRGISGPEDLAAPALAILVAWFSGGRSVLYLKRRDRWPPWRAQGSA